MFDFLKNMFGTPDNSELDKAIRDGAYLVDVRSPGEFGSGTVKGAVNIPLDRIEREIPRFRGKPGIVVFCASGFRSGKAQKILQRHGLENVINGGTWRDVKNRVG